MRLYKTIPFVLAALLAIPFTATPTQAQTNTVNTVQLAALFDLDGEATDADQVVTVVNLTNIALTIAAQPDVCRLITITIADTTPSITAGTTTLVGTDCDGNTQTEILDGSGGAGTVTSTLLFESIASATNAAYATLGGAGDETITVGVAALADTSYYYPTMLGQNDGALNRARRVPIYIDTTGSSTTTAAVTTATIPFFHVAVGDIIGVLRADGGTPGSTSPLIWGSPGYMWRTVTARASSDSITVDTAWDLSDPVVGTHFFHRRASAGAGVNDGWMPVRGKDAVWIVNVQQMSGTGGINYKVVCKYAAASLNEFTAVGPTNIAAASSIAIELTDHMYSHCRAGLRWVTNDDGTDTGSDIEQISMMFASVPR